MEKKRVHISKKSIFVFLLSAFFIFSIFIIRFNIVFENKLIKRKLAWEGLQKIVAKEIINFPGTAGIIIQDLKTGWRIAVNEHKVFPAASIIKIPIMLSVEMAVLGNKLNPNEEITIRDSDIVSGSGIIKTWPKGSSLSLYDAEYLMLTISDNTAANILIKKLGFDYLNSSFQDMGLKNTALRREMMNFDKRSRGIENYTTASDMATMLENLYFKRLINSRISSQCIELLKNQVYKDRIPKKLWQDAIVANKTGLEKGICHDIGIIYTPKGDLLVCVLTQSKLNLQDVKKFISDIAFYAYIYIEQLK